MPKVTVVIPCYNHGQYLDEAVDSILAQTYDDYEIVVVNDGSTDPFTRELLRNYDRPKTRVIHKENGHLSSARNHGIRQALSPYILTLDADDKFAPTFLEKAVPILDTEPTVGVVTSWVQNFGESGHVTHTKGGGLTNFLTRNCCVASALFRRECWEKTGGYNEEMKSGYEDWDFWLSVCENGWTVHVIPECLFHYRVSRGSLVGRADCIRPELVRELVERHKEAYAQHVAMVVYEKERALQWQDMKQEELRKSFTYKLGRMAINPFRATVWLYRVIRARRRRAW